MLNFALYAALRLAGLLLDVLPATLMYRIASLAGTCAYFLVRGARAGVSANLAVVLNGSPTSPHVRAAARRAFQNDAMNWLDTLRIGRLSLGEIEHMVQVDDWSPLERAAEAGRGVILVTLHVGNFDLVGQLLVARGYRLTVPVEQMQPRVLFDYLLAQRTRNGITIVPVERASRELLRALRAGQLVGLAGDRNVAGRVARVPVLARPAVLPLGPVSLARRTGAPLLLAIGVREAPGRFRGIMRSIPVTRTRDEAADDAENLAAFARELEQVLIRYGDQWLAFKPFWDGNAGENATATMGHQKRAAV